MIKRFIAKNKLKPIGDFIEEWIISRLKDGFSEFKLETATDIMEKTIELFDENNNRYSYYFCSEAELEVKNGNIATVMKAQLPTKEEADVSQLIRAEKNMPMTSVKAEYIHAAIGEKFTENTEKHEFTNELIGKHIRFRYSSNDTYEHIYLNNKFYTWLEKVVPTIGTVIEDLSPDVMRSFGKIAGYESYFKEMECSTDYCCSYFWSLCL